MSPYACTQKSLPGEVDWKFAKWVYLGDVGWACLMLAAIGLGCKVLDRKMKDVG